METHGKNIVDKCVFFTTYRSYEYGRENRTKWNELKFKKLKGDQPIELKIQNIMRLDLDELMIFREFLVACGLFGIAPVMHKE